MLKLICLHCDVMFNDYELFAHHTAEYVNYQPFKCCYCEDKFHTVFGIMAHMDDKHKSESFLAHFEHRPIGKKCFYDLVAHGVVEGARGFPEDKRPSLADSAPLLKLKCDKDGCGLSFERVDDLIKHLFEERLPFSRQYKCPHCSKINNDPHRVQKHLQEKHRIPKCQADRFLVNCGEEQRVIQQKVKDILEAFQKLLIEENEDRAQERNDGEPGDDERHDDNLRGLPPYDSFAPEDGQPTQEQQHGPHEEENHQDVHIDAASNEPSMDMNPEVTQPGEADDEQQSEGCTQMKGDVPKEHLNLNSLGSADGDLSTAGNDEEGLENPVDDSRMGDVAQQPLESDSEYSRDMEDIITIYSPASECTQSPDREDENELDEPSCSYGEPRPKMRKLDFNNVNLEAVNSGAQSSMQSLDFDRSKVKTEPMEFEGGRQNRVVKVAVRREDQPGPSQMIDNLNDGKGKQTHVEVIERDHLEIKKPAFANDLSTLLYNLNLHYEKKALESVIYNHATTCRKTEKNSPVITDEDIRRLARASYAQDGECLEQDFCNSGENIAVVNIISTPPEEYKPVGFQYLESNVFNGKSSLKKERFSYRCSCTGRCSVQCHCWKLSVAYGQCFINGNSVVRLTDSYHESLVFACGPQCQCSEECGNRLPQRKSMAGLQLFQRDSRIGMAVRTTVAVHTGDIVAEVTGEVIRLEAGSSEVNINSRYSWTIFSKNPEDCLALRAFVKGVMDVKRATWPKKVVLEVAKKGNVARFFSTSEWPNVLPLRAVENDIRPVSIRLLLVCCRPVLANQEILTDYGGRYKLDTCLCAMPTCGRRLPRLRKQRTADGTMGALLKVVDEMKRDMPRKDREMSEDEKKELFLKCSRAYAHGFRTEKDKIKYYFGDNQRISVILTLPLQDLNLFSESSMVTANVFSQLLLRIFL